MVLLRPGEWPSSTVRERMLEALASFEDVADPIAAGQAWRTAAENWPDETIAWLGVGNAAHRRRDWNAAREAYERVLALDSEHLPARLNLALSLIEMGLPCDALRRLGSAPPQDHPLAATFAELESRLRRECR